MALQGLRAGPGNKGSTARMLCLPKRWLHRNENNRLVDPHLVFLEVDYELDRPTLEGALFPGRLSIFEQPKRIDELAERRPRSVHEKRHFLSIKRMTPKKAAVLPTVREAPVTVDYR